MKLETKLKHTPAPWEHLAIPHNRATSVQYEIVSDDSMSIAFTRESPWEKDDPEADMNEAYAGLIAAAPDLLDALMKATLLLKHAHDDASALESQYAVETAIVCRQALTKAIGETQE